VTYLDTSALLAELLAEDRRSPVTLWDESLVSSRLLEYEVWTRLHARGLTRSHGDAARQLLGRVAMLEMASPVLARALDPFPREVRTIDALHLASFEFLRERDVTLKLATFDTRLADAAAAMGIALYPTT
jgi:predicted nucleic acid-binding protein